MFSSRFNQWQAICASPLEPKLWLELLREYSRNNMIWQAIYSAKKLAFISPDGISKASEILGGNEWRRGDAGDGALAMPVLNNIELQIDKFSNWLDNNPCDWITWVYLTRLYDLTTDGVHKRSKFEDAFNNAKELEYIAGESAHLLGGWRLKSGDSTGAVSILSTLIDVRPIRYGSMMSLGLALLRLGNVIAAEKAFSRASLSNNPDFLALLAHNVYENNYWQEAIEILNKAVSINPRCVDAWVQLARIQGETYQLADSLRSIEVINEIDPGNTWAELLHRSLFGKMGDAKAYIDEVKNLLKEKKGDTRLISTLLMTSLYQDDLTANDVFTLHKNHCSEIEKSITQREWSRKPSDRSILRVGYVTGDLHRQHPVNIFMLPLLLEQKKSKNLEIFVYHTGKMYDAYTKQSRESVHHWVEVADLDDFQLHNLISDDELDVLIDLAGHSSSHRLGVFLQRSAPVQATFLGYPHSTGLACIDYLIGDKHVSPPEHAHLYSERLTRLDGSVFCWAPVDDYPLPANRPDDAPVVFGSFNNILKVSPRTIKLWADVLKAVPGSALLLKAPSLKDETVCERYTKLFESHGVESNRIVYRGPSELATMMQEYGDIDVALDPLPYNGGTTSLQALWMGVPLVTLCGKNFPSRMGASFLDSLGQSNWIAHDEDSYIAIAKNMAKHIKSIRRKRVQFRQSMANSKLCDIVEYARNFERLLFDMKIKGGDV